MKRLIIGLIALAVMLMGTKAMADIKQDSVKVVLSVLQIVALDVVEAQVVVIPGPEDYAVKMDDGKNYITHCSRWPQDDYGFADRADAIKVKIFSNAMKGARVYVHGVANPQHNKSLRVEDIYLTVMKEKTYVLANRVGNIPDAVLGPVSSSRTPCPICGAGKCIKGLDDAYATAHTDSGVDRAARWLQVDNEAKLLFGVGKSTKAERLWVLKIGIANLARYTENLTGYEADLTFTLMPTVT